MIKFGTGGWRAIIGDAFTKANVQLLTLALARKMKDEDKTEKGFADSMRHIVGAAFDYKKFSVYAEYVMSKNDPFIGGTADSLALGDDGRWNTLLNLTFIYNF